MITSGYDQLVAKLDAFTKKYYKNQLVKGAIYSIALSLGFFLSVALIEHFGRFGTGIRTFLFYAFIAGNLAIWVRFIFFPLLKLWKIGKVISHEQAAEIIGVHFAEVKDKLLNILQLKHLSENQQNTDLVMASIDQKTIELKPVPFSNAINISENKKYLKFAIIPLTLFIFILFAAPSIITDSTKRIVSHGTYFEKEAPFSFVLGNEDLTAMEFEDFPLEISTTGDLVPKNVYIEIEGNQFKLENIDKGKFKYLFKTPQKDISFRLYADGFYSQPYTLDVVSKPMVTGVSIHLDFPDYLGMKDEELKNLGDLTIPQGTKVTWKLQTKSVQSIMIRIGDSLWNKTLTSNIYQFTEKVLANTDYTLKASNEDVHPKDSIFHIIRVIPDLYPSLEVGELKDTLVSSRLYFKGEIKDDHGFRKLNFYFVTKSSETGQEAFKMVPIQINEKQTEQSFYHYLDAKELNLSAGDAISYYFEVWDNDGVNGSKATKSGLRTFKLPTKEEIQEKFEKNNEIIKNDLDQSIDQAKDLQKEISQLNKELLQKKNLTWQDKNKLQKLLEQQQELQKQLEEIKKTTQQNNKDRQELTPQEQQILDKQELLEKMMEKMNNEDLKKMLEDLEKMMEKLDKNQMKDMLEKMKMSTEDLEKELDRTLEIFKQLEFEQKLQDIIEQIKDLKEKQDKLAEESKDKKDTNGEQKQKQDALKEKFDQLKEDLKELQKKNEEMQNPKDMKDSEDTQKKIEEEMKKASEQLGEQQNKKASDSQKKAGQEMEKMQQQMEDMQMSMQEQQQQENMEDLRQILENLLTLSFDQEAVMEKLKNTNRNNPQYKELSKQQKKLKDDSKIIEDSLLALSKRMIELESFVNKEISAVKNGMGQAIEFMTEGYIPQASSKQQTALTSINNLALMLSEAIEQLQNQMNAQAKAKGSASCSKPGMAMTPSMSELLQKQMGMQQKMEELQKKMGGKKPGEEGKEGQSGGGEGENGNISKDLVKMAAEQEAIRKELQKLSEQLGNGQKQGMQDILKKMEENETDLLNKRITNETLKRQKDITIRLLESEKAQREQEMDDKRESNEGKETPLPNIPALEQYFKQKQNEIELIKTIPPSLRPYYKTKVSEYFNHF